jgi:hypothetical protein
MYLLAEATGPCSLAFEDKLIKAAKTFMTVRTSKTATKKQARRPAFPLFSVPERIIGQQKTPGVCQRCFGIQSQNTKQIQQIQIRNRQRKSVFVFRCSKNNHDHVTCHPAERFAEIPGSACPNNDKKFLNPAGFS